LRLSLQLRALQEQATKSAKGMMDAYFSRIKRLSESDKLESRLRFMLLDVIEQRARGWETRRKKEGPKKIEVGSARFLCCA
jgi:translation initiation factor 4G